VGLFKTIVLAFIIFSLFGLNANALDITIKGAKEDNASYSILHLNDKNKFLCQEIKDDFDKVLKIVCAFDKSPANKLHNIQNSFFKIKTEIKKQTFFLIITPIQKMKLLPVVFDLITDKTSFKATIKLSSSWMILAYQDEPPFLKSNLFSETSINFPYTHTNNKLPFVGSLDIEGNPVFIKKVEDVKEFLEIKNLYDEKHYEEASRKITNVEEKYPDTLFLAELLYYKIKVNNMLEEPNKAIANSKIFIREFSSDENMAEVLSLLSRAYLQMGSIEDADYFLSRLFTEYTDSVYAKKGYIYKGEMLERMGNKLEAIFFFNKALTETSDIDVAAEAGYKLSHVYLRNAESEKAAKYTQKLAKAKPDYFAKHFLASIEMMNDYVNIQDYKSASTIASCLANTVGKKNDEHEKLLRDAGIWLSLTDDKKEALKILNKYIENYRNGTFIDEIVIAKDSLFFTPTDENSTTKLQNFEKLISKYQNDSIGSMAIYKKAKLLLELKRHNEVLAMQDDLHNLNDTTYKDIDSIINEGVIGSMEDALKNKECNRVLELASKYNIKLSDSWDDGIYECAMKGGDYTLAKSTANKNFKSPDMEFKKKWLFRYIEVDFATGNYTNVISASKELITLIEDDKDSEYKEVYRMLFDTYNRVEKKSQMISSIDDITNAFGLSYKDIDRYIAMVTVADKLRDNNLVIKYAKEVMDIQKSSSSFAQSPFVEFTLYQAYINKEDYNNALNVIKSLNSIEISNYDRARQKYLLGSIYSKLWRKDDANTAYDEAIKADAKSPWADLAKGAKSI
jgi:tetratricopeptide (TPR) repeat protein